MPADDAMAQRRRHMLGLVERFHDTGGVNPAALASSVAAGMADHDDAVESFLGVAEPPPGGTTPEWALEQESIVNRAPRGTWSILRLQSGWMSLISDGMHGNHLPMHCRTWHDSMPTYARAYAEMVGQEAYRLLPLAKAGAAERVVARHDVKPGDGYPGPVSMGGSRLFSVRVTMVQGGIVYLSGYRKGSNVMRSGPIEGDDLARQVDLSAPRAPDPNGFTDADVLEWLGLARAVFARIHAATEWGREHASDAAMKAGSPLHAALRAARSALPAPGMTWTDEASRSMVEAADGSFPTLAAIGSHAGPDILATAAALRISQAAIRGRPGDILGPDEATVLAEAASDPALAEATREAARKLAAGTPSSWPEDRPGGMRPSQFTAAFSWDKREGRTRGRGRATSSTVETHVKGPADPDAPVALRLATPDGGWLDVRSVDGTLMRPVLSPGSWEPAGLAAFVDAATAGVPWADNPFAPRPAGMPLAGIRDIASPETRARPYDEDRKRALDTATHAAGTLRLVDGVVHRPVGHLRVLPIRSDATPPGYGWRSGPLTCLDAMRGLRLSNAGIQVHDASVRDGWAGRSRGNHLTSLPVQDAWRIPGILRHVGDIGMPADADPMDGVRLVAPHLLPAEDDAPFRAMRDWVGTVFVGEAHASVREDFVEACRIAGMSAGAGKPVAIPDATRLPIPDGARALFETLSEWGEEVAKRLSLEDGADLGAFVP